MKVVQGHKRPVTRQRSAGGVKYHRDEGSSRCCRRNRQVVKRANPKSSHHKKKIFFPFFLFIVPTGEDGY